MTLRELSTLSGISIATISLVLNNKGDISDETRKIVFDLVKKYNYSLPQKNKTSTKSLLFLKYINHGLVVEENPGFISTIMDSIEKECQNQQYKLIITVCRNSLEQTLNSLDYQSCQGVIVLGTEINESDYSLLSQIKCPYIVLDNSMPNFDCNAIYINNELVAYEAAHHLLSLGHSNIGYLHSSQKLQNFKEREIGVRRAISPLLVKQIQLRPTFLGAYDDMNSYLRDGNSPPPALVSDNDIIAIGAMKALLEAGYLIPQDIIVIGVDNIAFSEACTPSLSTMEIDKVRIGKLSVRILTNIIEESVTATSNIKIQVNGSLIKRESTYK